MTGKNGGEEGFLWCGDCYSFFRDRKRERGVRWWNLFLVSEGGDFFEFEEKE